MFRKETLEIFGALVLFVASIFVLVHLATKQKATTLFLNGAVTFETTQPIIDKLLDAKEGDTIHIRANSPGGDLSSAFPFFEAMAQSKAHVVYDIIFEASSAGAVAACYADEVTATPRAYLFWHTIQVYGIDYFDSSFLTEAEKIAYSEIFRRGMAPCVGQGILTQDAVDVIASGNDIYMFPTDNNEVTIENSEIVIDPYVKPSEERLLFEILERVK